MSAVVSRGPALAWSVPALAAAMTMLGLAVAVVGDARQAVLVLGALAGLAALGLVAIAAPGRLVDVLLLASIGTVTVPLDKYLFFEQHVGGWPGLRVALSDLPLLVLAPVLALGWTLSRVRPGLPGPVVALSLAWTAWAGLSALGASRPMLAGFELASMVHALTIAVVLAAGVARRHLPLVVWVLALQVLVHTGFAVVQVITGRNVGASWFQGAAVVQEALESGAVRIRPSGLFDHPIVYADMLLITLPVLGAAVVAHPSRWQRVLLGGVALIGAAGLALTLSRGAWIATAVAAVTMVIWMMRQRALSAVALRRVCVASAVAGLVLGIAFGPRAYERLTASNEGNLRVRFELNWIAWNMIVAHPITGVGLSHFIDEMEHYDPTNVKKYFPATVHNLYLLEASETGVPGLLLALSVFGAILWYGGTRVRSMRDPLSQVVVIALLSGLVGFLVSQLADFSHRIEPLRSLIWTGIGLLFALQRGDRGLGGQES